MGDKLFYAGLVLLAVVVWFLSKKLIPESKNKQHDIIEEERLRQFNDINKY